MAQEEPRTTRGGGMRGRRERRRLQMVFNHLREQHSPLRAAPLRRLAPLRITTTAQQPSNEDVDLRIEEGAVPPDVEIFDMECVSIRGFDRDEFLREGRWLWAGVMPPANKYHASHPIAHPSASRPGASHTIARLGVSLPGVSHPALDTLSTCASYLGASHPRTPCCSNVLLLV